MLEDAERGWRQGGNFLPGEESWTASLQSVLTMGTETKGGLCPNLEDLLRSDLLPKLVALLDSFPSLKPLFPKLLQLRLVADANRVRAELYWRLRKRRNPANRSSLHESIDAGVVVFFVPEHAKWEIEKHYEDIARQARTTIAEVKQEWAQFQKSLRFYAPKMRPSTTQTYADLDDFPYLATCLELDAQAIYTMDRHLAAMGAPVVSVLIDTHLRDYARASAVQIAVGIGSSVSFVVGRDFLQGLYKLLVRCVKAIRRLPPAAQIGLAAAGVICVAHPKSRARLKKGWNTLKNSEVLLALGDALADFAVQVTDSAEKAEINYQILQATLPGKEKRPLLMHARAVCTAAASPLTLVEMERQIRLGGYVSRSQTFRQYLRRVLRTDRSFVEVRPGRWAIHTAITSS